MSTEQHDSDPYGRELARIGHHQSEATGARFTVFNALAAVGIAPEQADELVSKLDAGAVEGAHPRSSRRRAVRGCPCGRSMRGTPC
ncbi:hypothetical protein CG724_33090 [Streptomyces sp. CB02120-2]|nr:hypothetical protein CG724_33090 [Streptomyces sp. CB02120-2]